MTLFYGITNCRYSRTCLGRTHLLRSDMDEMSFGTWTSKTDTRDVIGNGSFHYVTMLVQCNVMCRPISTVSFFICIFAICKLFTMSFSSNILCSVVFIRSHVLPGEWSNFECRHDLIVQVRWSLKTGGRQRQRERERERARERETDRQGEGGGRTGSAYCR